MTQINQHQMRCKKGGDFPSMEGKKTQGEKAKAQSSPSQEAYDRNLVAIL